MRADSAGMRTRGTLAETALVLSALWLCAGACGCAERFGYARLSAPYDRTQLKLSTTLDVLNLTQAADSQFDPRAVSKQLLSQSDTVIALTGQRKDGFKSWLNMVVFDEYRMTAARKYFFCTDEKAMVAPTDPTYYLIPPRRGLLFDAEFVIDPEIRTTPYATEEAATIAIVRWLAEQFHSDVQALLADPQGAVQDNELVTMSEMMMNQVFRGILIELDKSPGLARNLGAPQGIAFPHISLDTGHIQLLAEGDIAKVKIRVNLPMVPLRDQ